MLFSMLLLYVFVKFLIGQKQNSKLYNAFLDQSQTIHQTN